LKEETFVSMEGKEEKTVAGGCGHANEDEDISFPGTLKEKGVFPDISVKTHRGDTMSMKSEPKTVISEVVLSLEVAQGTKTGLEE